MHETKRDGFIRLMHRLVDGLAQDISEIDGANSEHACGMIGCGKAQADRETCLTTTPQ